MESYDRLSHEEKHLKNNKWKLISWAENIYLLMSKVRIFLNVEHGRHVIIIYFTCIFNIPRRSAEERNFSKLLPVLTKPKKNVYLECNQYVWARCWASVRLIISVSDSKIIRSSSDNTSNIFYPSLTSCAENKRHSWSRAKRTPRKICPADWRWNST